MSSAFDLDTQRQYRYAQTMQTVLVVVGVALLGAGFGYWSAHIAAIEAGCTVSTFDPNAPCTVLLQSLSGRVTAALGGGVFALAAAGGMEYLLRRAVP